MHPRSDYFPGMRRPGENERQMIAAQWKFGTNPGAIRASQMLTLLLTLAVAYFAFLSGAGFSGEMLVVIGFILLMIFLLIFWGSFIKSIRMRTEQLEKGNFTIAAVFGERPGTMRTYNYYVGFADAKLGDGSVIRGLQMPYKPALQMRRKRISSFPAYLVQIDGETKPMIFCR